MHRRGLWTLEPAGAGSARLRYTPHLSDTPHTIYMRRSNNTIGPQSRSRPSGATCGSVCCSVCWWPPWLDSCSLSSLAAVEKRRSLGKKTKQRCQHIFLCSSNFILKSTVCRSAFKPPGPESLVSFTAARSFNRSGSEQQESTCEWCLMIRLAGPSLSAKIKV